jgi:coenzyme F420-reducing hydrogenase beta subunit
MIRLRSARYEIPLKELHQYVEPFCRFCGDFIEQQTFLVSRASA